MAPFGFLLLSALTATTTAIPALNSLNRHPGIPASQHHLASNSHSLPNAYKCFDSETLNHPQVGDWLSFDALWDINRPSVLSRNGGDTYIEHYVREAIIKVSKDRDVDARVILAAIMQVSEGKVTAPCFGPSRVNCDKRFDALRPEASITQMVNESFESISKKDCWLGYLGYFAPDYQCFQPGYVRDLSNRLIGWNGRGKGYKNC